jgi:hypothetical protein
VALLVTADEIAAVLGWPQGSDLTPLEQIAEASDKLVRRYLDPNLEPHDDHPNDKEAALAVAVQVHQSRTAPGGQMQAVDYQPVVTPNLLGPGLMLRVQGLLGPCRAYGGLVVG